VTACGIELREEGGAVAAVAPALDVLMLNRVIGLGIREPVTESSLDAFLAFFRGAAVRRFFVPLSPAARPTDAAEFLLVGEALEDRPDRPSGSLRNLRRLGWEQLYLRPNDANVPPAV